MKVRSRYLVLLAIAWGPCLVAGAAAYAMILRPQQDCIEGLAAKVASGREDHARALQAAIEKDRSRLTREVEDLQQRVGDFVVSDQEAPGLAFTLGTLANEARLDSFGMRPVNRMGLDALPRWQHVGEKHVDLSFAAGFPRFAAFLNTLERHRPVVLVESFAISRPLDKEAPPQVSMELAVLVEKPAGSAGESQ